MPWLINAEQADSFRKNQKNLLVLDATWHSSDSSKARQDFVEQHIAGARFFDLNSFSDTHNPLPNMFLRDEQVGAELLGAMGVRPDCKIIFYDRSQFHSSCRALWTMKMLGHPPQLLYILDGGFPAWEKYGGKIENGEVHTAAKTYSAKFQEKYLRTLAQMKTNIQNPVEQVIDARSAVRFVGGAESRPGLRPGHIPGSFCFPFHVIFDKEGFFLPLEKIRRRLEGIGLDPQHASITSCGSGMTACVLNFILDLLGNENNALYDGSWTEWGASSLYPGEASLSERPVETCI